VHKLRIVLAALLAVACAPPLFAQQRPLVTEDPETIGEGRVLLEAGLDRNLDQVYPVSGLRGDLWRAPTIGISVGLGKIAELQIDGGLYSRLSITRRDPAPLSSLVTATGSSTDDVEDFTMATKIRISPEKGRRPALGFRFGTKLPNASNESGLGTDTMDFLASVLAGKTIQSVRVVGNAGFAILSDPTEGNRQNDVFTYGVSVARAVSQKIEFVGEVNGRVSTRAGEPFPGTETRGLLTFGARYTRAALRVDAGLLVGLTDVDPTIGFTTGLTYVFNAFSVP
jgi:hypothetical protein